MDASILERLRASLTKERADLVEQLNDMGVSAETGTPTEDAFDHNFADSGQATAEKAQMLSIAEGLFETLKEVDAALERMDDGTYGTCISCGSEIPAERLDARPYASECMACKQRG